MAGIPVLALVLCAMACTAAAQPATAEAAPEGEGASTAAKVSFRPSVGIVVGIFTMIFSLTFLLLVYAKFCHPSASPAPGLPSTAPAPVPAQEGEAEGGGVAKTVVESLPMFRFAALRGAREGLECAVCLARFDDADLLRLLPRCRHGFHLECVDRWLESSASCPLCRARVDADDKYAAAAAAVLGDMFVERVPSSRFEDEEDPHKHRIVVLRSRWSDLNRADIMALDAQMLRSMSSGRLPDHLFAGEEEEPNPSPKPERELELEVTVATEKKRLLELEKRAAAGGCGCSSREAVDALHPSSAARMISSGVRSMSEIVSLPRLRAVLTDEDMARRRWLPIARRTARWLAGRERRYDTGEGAQASASAHSQV